MNLPTRLGKVNEKLEDTWQRVIQAETEAVTRLNEAKEMDAEKGHYHADKALTDFLDKMGFHRVTALWDELPKYYA